MKRSTWLQLMTATAVSLGAASGGGEQVLAQRTTFVCVLDMAGVPTTYAQTSRGMVPVVKWVSEHFTDAGYTPERRCQEVTSKFNTLYNQGRLNYLSAGYKNGQAIICALGAVGGECTQLYTLKPGQDPAIVLQRLRAVQRGAAGPLYESSRGNSGGGDAIDLNQYINTAPTEQMQGGSQPCAAPAAPAAAPQPAEGQVVGINGMHAYPLWGDPYVFKDGSLPCPKMRAVMEQSSWAIPIETFAKLAGFSVIAAADNVRHRSSFYCGNSPPIKPEIRPVLIDPIQPILPFFQQPLW